MSDCADVIEGLSPNFHYYVSGGIGVVASLMVLIAYNIQEYKRKKTFYGVEDKEEIQQIELDRQKSIKERSTEMKIAYSKEAADNGEVKVLVRAKKRGPHSGSLIHDEYLDWASTPLIHSYMRQPSPASLTRSIVAPATGYSREMAIPPKSRPIKSGEPLKTMKTMRLSRSSFRRPTSEVRSKSRKNSKERPTVRDRKSMKNQPMSSSTTQATQVKTRTTRSNISD